MTSHPSGIQQASHQRNGSGGWAPPRPPSSTSVPPQPPPLALPQQLQQQDLLSTTAAQRQASNLESAPGLENKLVQGGQHTPADGSASTPTSSMVESGGPNVKADADTALQPSSSATEPMATLSTIPSIPFPTRPGRNVIEGRLQNLQTANERTNPGQRDLRSISLDVPTAALLYPQDKAADYSPWNGTHQEDSISEQSVKSGFQNKPLITNETNMARPSLWSHLKNKSGLQTLSSLFVSVLENRQTSGRLTAPSTFKPPPRVALNNAKREIWLRDLANPTCPVRRLSRTIPHGISGKVLLEQCLNNRVPTARAVWLAKCIGANEIRAFKRKGASSSTAANGELKWVREWTMHVEQFLDSTLNDCGEADWRSKMEYVIRFSSQLFSEQLLDQDHFLDWILNSFNTSSLERLPIWLLLIQIYWNHFVSNRKRGRNLAQSLLMQLENRSSADASDLLGPVLERIRELVMALAISHKGCLILPRTWHRFRKLAQSTYTDKVNTEAVAAINNIITRNDRLATSVVKFDQISSPGSQIISVLDGALVDESLDLTALNCQEATSDVTVLVRTILLWASSIYRPGWHRIYVAARLLRKLKTQYLDVDGAIWASLSELGEEAQGVDESRVFRVIVELVRSRHFSVGRFLQRLISTGTLSSSSAVTEAKDGSTKSSHTSGRLIRLLQYIPTQGLPDHLCNLRLILLDSARIFSATNSGSIDALRQSISQRLEQPPKSSYGPETGLHELISSLNLSDRLDAAAWLRSSVLAQMSQTTKKPGPDENEQNNQDISESLYQFHIIRDVLEQLEDYPILADVLGICLETTDGDFLVSIADTIHYHHKTLSAIGGMARLFGRLLEKYHYLRNEQRLNRSLCLSLLELCSTLGAEEFISEQISQDLVRCDQLNTAAMCSPASDNAAEVLHSSNIESDDEIERILASGTTMEEQMVVRVFNRITSRVMEHYKSSSVDPIPAGSWLSRLRAFDQATFDGLLREWISSMLSTSTETLYALALPMIVGSGCLNLDGYVQCVASCFQTINWGSESSKCLSQMELLANLLPDVSLCQNTCMAESYRHRLEKRNYAAASRKTIFEMLQHLINIDRNSTDPEIRTRLDELLHSSVLRSFLRESAVESQTSFTQLSEMFSGDSSSGSNIFNEMVEQLVDPGNHLNLHEKSSHEVITCAISAADELSLPFCVLQIQSALSAERESIDEAAEERTNSSLFNAIVMAANDVNGVWRRLLASLDSTKQRQICKRAEAHVLAGVPSFSSITAKSGLDVKSESFNLQIKDLQKHLRIINCTAKDVPDEHSPAINSTVTEKLRDISDALLSFQTENIDFEEESKKFEMICHWIDTLLDLCMVHKNPSHNAKATSGDQSLFLSTLCSLLTLPQLQAFPETVEHIFDMAALLTDDLSEDQWFMASRIECQKHSDARIAFLFGSTPSPDGWFGLVTTQPTTSATASTPGTASTSAGRPSGSTPATPTTVRSGQAQAGRTPSGSRAGTSQSPQKAFNPPVPYAIRHWELFPDFGNSAAANDTAISLGLFGARKV